MGNTARSKSIADDVVVRRLYARGKWKLDSVAHFGGDETGVADMCLLQNAEGKPFIPGASITGAARSILARKCLAWRQYKKGLANEPRSLKDFFGGADKDDRMSALIVSDAACVSEKVNRTIRDGVSIDIKSGTAKTGAKYDVEVVERGTEFELHLACIIRSGDNIEGITDGATEPNFEDLFCALLKAFQDGDIRLGARTRRGYGRGKVESWKIRDLDMSDPQDVMAWLRDDPWSRPKSCLSLKPLPTDQRSYFRIEADFELRTSLLIRSVSGEPNAPDMVHLQSDGEPVVPGTSFAGAFRHRATLIATTKGWDVKNVEKMFGFVREKKRNNSQEPTTQASRILIEERLAENMEKEARWQNRVAIDRFTGGAVDGALFNEKPIYPIHIGKKNEEKETSNLRLILTLEEPEEAEIDLLLFTLRDFWHGQAALGGETSNGRGTLQGVKTRLKFKGPDSSDAEVWQLDHDGKILKIEKDNIDSLKSCVKKAKDYSNCPDGTRQPDTKDLPND